MTVTRLLIVNEVTDTVVKATTDRDEALSTVNRLRPDIYAIYAKVPMRQIEEAVEPEPPPPPRTKKRWEYL